MNQLHREKSMKVNNLNLIQQQNNKNCSSIMTKTKISISDCSQISSLNNKYITPILGFLIIILYLRNL